MVGTLHSPLAPTGECLPARIQTSLRRGPSPSGQSQPEDSPQRSETKNTVIFSFLNAKYNLNSRSSGSLEDNIQYNCFTYNLQIQNALQKNVISLLQTVDHYNEDYITTVQKVLLHNRFTL